MAKIMNNVVNKATMRDIQKRTLKQLSDVLVNSFGPNGSTTCIKKENALTRYTKDGHTIIGAIHYNGIIEQSIKDDVESITRHIVKTVGDGTTSAVLLSSIIFDRITEYEKRNPDVSSRSITSAITNVVSRITEKIKNSATELSLADVFNIAMISTNGDENIANILTSIYEEFGNSVFIDVSPSITEQTIIKSYNGMTLNSGYCDSCYVTNPKNNTSEVDHPMVYFFEHPIDTKELGVYLDAIISSNIITPCNTNQYDKVVPTVIFAPSISQDVSSTMDMLTSTLANTPVSNRLPICIICSYHEPEQLADLAKMCGAKMIRKYIDARMYEEDVKHGKAPTPETIHAWAGKCDRVVAYSDKTVFIRPSAMYNDDGSYSNLYDNMTAYLEAEIKNATDNGENIRDVGKLKRRLHSLKSNMVELFIGGITESDRDASRDLVEDAVLNLRSAAVNGVGFAGNMSAVKAIEEFDANTLVSDLDADVFNIIADAYRQITGILFYNAFDEKNNETTYGVLAEAIKNGLTYNIRNKSWGKDVKSSIMSDIIILETVSKIIGMMATCNQFIVPTAMHNIYVD